MTRLQNKGTESNFGTAWLVFLSAKVPVPWSVIDALKTPYVLDYVLDINRQLSDSCWRCIKVIKGSVTNVS